jgi:hypothetical protein
MKNFLKRLSLFKYLFLLIAGLITFSCTEIIEIDLNDSEPQIVVEGMLPESDYAVFKLTQTVNMQENGEFPPLEKAKVTLSDQNGLTEILTETSPGIYRSKNIAGIPGINYNMQIQSGETLLKSSDMMPMPVRMKNIVVRKLNFSGSGFGNMQDSLPRLEVVVNYDDPAESVNYYRFVEYRNGKFANDYLDSDKFNNGKSVRKFLFSFDRIMLPGDTITIEMQNISKNVFEYFFSFSNMGGGPSSGSPANPNTNIEGGKLGYFSAFSSRKISVVLTPSMFL